MSKQMQFIGIAIVSLLILIFGALLGIFFSLNSSPEFFLDEDYFGEEIEPDIFGEHYSYDRLTLYQFSKYAQTEINNKEDLMNYLESEDYEIIEFEEDDIEGWKDNGCSYNEFFEKEICEYFSVILDDDEIDFFRYIEFEEEYDE